jgi:FlaG/FlaF family flagellin (archaellin)
MQYLRRLPGKNGDTAVSPVVGVILMLVVVIIIAAVVSGFSGGMIGANNQKAPTLNMDVKIINTGRWIGSGFFATVTGVSEPIPTKDLKIVTSWTAKELTYRGYQPGNYFGQSRSVSNQTTVYPSIQNIQYLGDPDIPLSPGLHVAPFGSGPGVNGTAGTIGGTDTLRDFSGSGQQFGNYTLVPGTTLTAMPCGAASSDYIGSTGLIGNPNAVNGYGVGTVSGYAKGLYFYTDETRGANPNVPPPPPSKYLDPTTAVLGGKWNRLKWGDTVNVKVIHIPTGKMIFQQDVPVTEA